MSPEDLARAVELAKQLPEYQRVCSASTSQAYGLASRDLAAILSTHAPESKDNA